MSEHEASKRFKNEFLSLLDGIDNSDHPGIFVLGSTNLPWEIDSAFLRRFERKILIDVPNTESRMDLVQQNLPKGNTWSKMDCREIAELTENYTGDDIRVAFKEATMIVIRDKIKKNTGKFFPIFVNSI